MLSLVHIISCPRQIKRKRLIEEVGKFVTNEIIFLSLLQSLWLDLLKGKRMEIKSATHPCNVIINWKCEIANSTCTTGNNT